MTTTTGARPSSKAAAGRRITPTVFWAALGVAVLAVEIAALMGWVLAGEAERTPRGPMPIPAYMTLGIHAIEAACSLGLLAVFWVYVGRPLKANGKLSLDGVMCIAFVSMAWQDTFLNYSKHWFTYNTATINLGSWNPHIIGWDSPHANLIPHPIVFYTGYGSVIFFGVVIGNAVVRRVARRYAFGPVRLVLAMFAFYMGFCLIEILFLRFGLYAYPAKVPGPVLFRGHFYQYPMLEWLSFVSVMTAWCALRYFRNDRGETVAERGIEALPVGPRTRTGMRFLALVGVCNLAFLVFYSVPLAVLGAHSGKWIDDVTERSYFLDGCAGPSTPYPCPTPP